MRVYHRYVTQVKQGIHYKDCRDGRQDNGLAEYDSLEDALENLPRLQVSIYGKKIFRVVKRLITEKDTVAWTSQ